MPTPTAHETASRPRRLRRTLTLLTLPALAAGLLTATTAAADPPRGQGHGRGDRANELVVTEQGKVRGVTTGDAQQFLGLPYAAPPVRELRFAPPAAPAGWEGVREADQQSPACLQFQPSGVREEQAVSEDCLYLDVYRPADVAEDEDLPVMVWFHGGGNTQGTGVIYGGSSLAEKTRSIVVTINYRLGALGFLAHPALSEVTPGGSGNYALMDQQASLEWVQDNISAFGGDADNVTIFGQSAGGGAVCNMLAAPSAEGLFDKAIIQSSACFSPTSNTLTAGEEGGEEYATAVGCTDPATVVECLRSTWPGTLIAHQGEYVGGAKTESGFLPVAFPDAFAQGTWNKVPIMTGTTRSEDRLTAQSRADITAEGVEEFVRTTYPDKAEQVLSLYPLSDFQSPYDQITQITTDAGRACKTELTARATSDQVPTYRYEFDDPTSPTLYGFELAGEDISNAHSAELQYLFDFTLGAEPLTAEQERLSDQMMRYWGSFAHDGDPNHRGAPYWPQYGDEENVMSLRPGGDSTVIRNFSEQHNCGLWLS
ncbi:carboxylesterase/lipase family protein [Kineococcus arenarius]|uniref:carboxylesterase/lipase family protein n=1 Tax=Kineococcus sp. SYSU DK007 TaxID=3383128 RepID=UPI003D7DD3E8